MASRQVLLLWSRVPGALRNYFYYGDPAIFGTLLLKRAPSGLMVMDRTNIVPSGAGFAIRGGLMYGTAE